MFAQLDEFAVSTAYIAELGGTEFGEVGLFRVASQLEGERDEGKKKKNLRRHQTGLLGPSWPSARDPSPLPGACTEGVDWSGDVQSGHGISVTVNAAGWA